MAWFFWMAKADPALLENYLDAEVSEGPIDLMTDYSGCGTAEQADCSIRCCDTSERARTVCTNAFHHLLAYQDVRTLIPKSVLTVPKRAGPPRLPAEELRLQSPWVHGCLRPFRPDALEQRQSK